MSDSEFLKPNSAPVIKHIEIYQSIINRMAGNSAACKQWAVGLVSAILMLIAEKGKVELAPLALFPILLFFFLDTYYLALEQQFRNAYSQFIKDLHSGNLTIEKLYVIRADGKLPQTFSKALRSFSTFPVYFMMGLLVWGARTLVTLWQ